MAAKKRTSATSCPVPQGKLLLIGGHEHKGDAPEDDEKAARNVNFAPEAILRRLAEEIGDRGPLVVIPTASEQSEESAQDYVRAFQRLGGPAVEVLNIKSRSEANDEARLRVLEEAGGVLFTGGDQLRLTALLGGSYLQHRLQERYSYDNFIVAGTSAGATAMSTPMVYQGRNDAGYLKGEIHITTGLELLHDVAVDTHFVARGRIVRMAQILATNPACVGMGLEEDTAVLVTEGQELEVLGSGLVVILDARACSSTNIHEIAPNTPFTLRGVELHLLASGERYTLPIQPRLYA
ncbi:cyanophycinase [Hymenobacter luteus]|uniref:Cyanophycinase n=2 Tax=Hymenobacter TaxID=89966 RepID=A0A7W9WE15_9BACT|nr:MULTISPECIES: cyanophycinase [Hymenobacter]MBB4603060.1 cyanophycinase [Hymenobacter latericoloratus]MBB6060981.1 cyanophycinase [Hymenobacter luteus]